jgi:hypothetical protein
MVAIEPYIGTYYSRDYVKRKVLRQTDEEIIEMEKEMEEENASGVGVPLETQQAIAQGRMQNDLGSVPKEPDLEKKKQSGATEAPSINIKKAKI